MVKLFYVGPQWDGVIGLPEGWPAADHEDGDAARTAEKLASGHYTVAPAAEPTGDALAAGPDEVDAKAARKRNG